MHASNEAGPPNEDILREEDWEKREIMWRMNPLNPANNANGPPKNSNNDAGPPNDSHWWGWRQNRYLVDSLRTPYWRGSCKFKCNYELPFNPELNFHEQIAGHMMQTKWVKHVSLMPSGCDMCHTDCVFRGSRGINGCGCHCGFDVCDTCLHKIREFQQTAEFTNGTAMRLTRNDKTILDEQNKIHIAENSAKIESMCPHNEIFVDRGEWGDVDKAKCDLIKFTDDLGHERFGFFLHLVDKHRPRPTVFYRTSTGGNNILVRAENFLNSWEYVYPDLRKHRGDPSMVSRVKAAGAAAAAKASAVGGAAGAAAAAAAQKAGLIKKYNSHADQKMDCITPNPYTI